MILLAFPMFASKELSVNHDRLASLFLFLFLFLSSGAIKRPANEFNLLRRMASWSVVYLVMDTG